MRSTRLLASLALLAIPACLDGGKGDEDELPTDDGKFDSQRSPTDHGVIPFGEKATSALTDAEHFHAWTFTLTGSASLDLTTSYAVRGQRRVDTVLYLYKEGATGWGSYIARNDDYADTVYSQIKKSLDAGHYRVLVKGLKSDTRGKFGLTVNCDGAGCAAPPVASCVFGQTYGDIETQSALQIINRNTITAATLGTLTAADQNRLLRAVHESAHTDVTTPAEAIAVVDQQEVNVTWIAEPAAQRMFVAFEYGAGDNSYGAVFNRDTDERVTAIHDGDLYECTAKAETCLLPDDWNGLKNNSTDYTKTLSRVITSSTTLDAVESAQLLAAFNRVYAPDGVTSVAQGLSMADNNQVNLVAFTHKATGTKITAVEFGAGDTSVGEIFYSGGTQVAGVISDLDIGACTFFGN